MGAVIGGVIGFLLGLYIPGANYRAGYGTPSRPPGVKPDRDLVIGGGCIGAVVGAIIGAVVGAIIGG